jgi:hypothetical protein
VSRISASATSEPLMTTSGSPSWSVVRYRAFLPISNQAESAVSRTRIAISLPSSRSQSSLARVDSRMLRLSTRAIGA